MPLTRAQKDQLIEKYMDLLQNSQGLIMADYRGLTVKEMQVLRRQVKEAGGHVQVVKNTLFRIALERLERPVPQELLVGPVVVGFGVTDVPPVAKAFVEYAKEASALKIKGGMLGNRILSSEEVEDLAKLPPMEVIRAQLIAAIEGPMTNLVGVISAPLREIVQVLKARSEQGEEAQAA